MRSLNGCPEAGSSFSPLGCLNFLTLAPRPGTYPLPGLQALILAPDANTSSPQPPAWELE